MLSPLLVAISLFGQAAPEALLPPADDGISRYLGFQIFSATTRAEVAFAAGFPALTYPPKENVAAMVDSIIAAIGTTGSSKTKLAFILGPLAFDHSDDDVRTMIHYAFAIAREKNIAVGFHIDDAMFWSNRTDLAANPDNIEWISFDPIRSRGLLLDWGGGPAAFPPRLCMSSPALLAEVARRARDVMGVAIVQETTALHAAGKDELFAGLIVGWESHMGHDSPTDQPLGFHALANAGYGPGHPPPSFGAENARTVKRYNRTLGARVCRRRCARQHAVFADQFPSAFSIRAAQTKQS